MAYTPCAVSRKESVSNDGEVSKDRLDGTDRHLWLYINSLLSSILQTNEEYLSSFAVLLISSEKSF